MLLQNVTADVAACRRIGFFANVCTGFSLMKWKMNAIIKWISVHV